MSTCAPPLPTTPRITHCATQARKSVANVLRLLADAMPPGTLNRQLVMRARYLDWIRDTVLFLKQLPRFGEAFWEVSQVGSGACFCIRLGSGFEIAGSSKGWCLCT